MLLNVTNKDEYEKYIGNLKKISRLVCNIYNSKEYKQGLSVSFLKKNGFIALVMRKIRSMRLKKKIKAYTRPLVTYKANYFSEHRIAVYTCVFGKYDSIAEPICQPDNIDYYIITDLEADDRSIWKRVDISPYNAILTGMTDVEKNRWFKMHPNHVFSEYKYSIYIDGNVKPVTDFTEFVNRIGDCGVAMFWHSYNNCIYQEALFNKYAVRKISTAEVDKQIKYLKSQNMPEDYGMTTCNVIAREHFNPVCCKLMDDWWEEFINHCRRDQLSFPFVAWKNNIKMEDIAVLGNNVWDTDTLIVMQHN